MNSQASMAKRGPKKTRDVADPELPAPVALEWVIKDGDYWVVPTECRDLAWPTPPSVVATLYFQIVGDERVRVHLGYPHQESVNAAYDDPSEDGQRRADAHLLIYREDYIPTGKLLVPPIVQAHVTGKPGDEKAGFWFWASANILEMWGERVRIERMAAASARLRQRDPFNPP